ncbi:MAG: 3-dehydroquinate synthase [Bacteroidia bacterium]
MLTNATWQKIPLQPIYDIAWAAVDGKVYTLWKDVLDSWLPRAKWITLHASEEKKSLSTLRYLWKKLYQQQIARDQPIAAIGGGTILDTVGFAAATYKRGIPWHAVPTTLLAQVDAAWGGKTGINFRQTKNLLGAFHMPEQVWVFQDFLQTLPDRQRKSGFAEMLKHALLDSPQSWDQIQALSPTTIPSLATLQQAALFKIHVCEQDPHEKDRRSLLNLGHTLGHAWEMLSHKTSMPVTHGEAVAMGIATELYLSVEKGYLRAGTFEQILQALHRWGYLLPLPPFTYKQLAKLLWQDKKVFAHQLRIVALYDIGQPAGLIPITWHEVQKAVRWYRTSPWCA